MPDYLPKQPIAWSVFVNSNCSNVVLLALKHLVNTSHWYLLRLLLFSLRFTPFALTSPCRFPLLPEGVLIAFVLLSPRTSVSTDRFSCADYVVPLTHRFHRLLSHSMMTCPSD